jgi:sulfhydrogenase subunit alpha
MEPTRTIRVKALARVEGEGGLTIRLRDGKPESVELRIFEPPRFYEAFLRGRSAAEVPDITARICGICPVAYQMSAVHAIEKIYHVEMPPPLRDLRRLLYCGEWIESHCLHIFLLHAPDFLGYESAMAFAQADPHLAEILRRGLRMKKAGNHLIRIVGGREVHPINVRVGGFYRLPNHQELLDLLPELQWAREAARETVRWTATLLQDNDQGDYEFVCLRHDDEYPMNEGRLVSSAGLDVVQEDFPNHFEEYQVPHSNALQSRRTNGGPYFVGPLARWNRNHDRAPAIVRDTAQAAGITLPCRNPSASIVIRALEVLLAFDEAIRLITEYQPSSIAFVEHEPRAGIGAAITEAPRGILYQRFETDAQGRILSATITPPTSQNQGQIEHDLLTLVSGIAELPEAEVALRAEKVIRHYDPCISCATHFLKLNMVHL